MKRTMTIYLFIASLLSLFGKLSLVAFGIRISGTESLKSLIQQASERSFSLQVAVLWSSAIVQAVWVIWKTRNDAIFEDSPPNISHALRLIWNCIKEADYFRLGCMHNSLSDFHILKLLQIKGNLRPAPRIIHVIWHPPLGSWTKVNTDGSALGSPGIAGGGGIFRNSNSFTRGAFSFCLGVEFAFVAELATAIMAVNIAWRRGWHYLWLECDSSYVVQLFLSKSINVPWVYLHRWITCLHQVSHMTFQVI
ncbi:uncharacterized protein LOC130015445 isoform X2 [Mercurialis annua]|uniref:uncharacterized protein LOC130015445 isoform X2 n=1 Tax=Mercurialis annua TaxID=3986 RepID=UPI0024AF68B7|nr:uncharacterized protein LOC130015445 isoform X2 [Mercurialis annua]